MNHYRFVSHFPVRMECRRKYLKLKQKLDEKDRIIKQVRDAFHAKQSHKNSSGSSSFSKDISGETEQECTATQHATQMLAEKDRIHDRIIKSMRHKMPSKRSRRNRTSSTSSSKKVSSQTEYEYAIKMLARLKEENSLLRQNANLQSQVNGCQHSKNRNASQTHFTSPLVQDDYLDLLEERALTLQREQEAWTSLNERALSALTLQREQEVNKSTLSHHNEVEVPFSSQPPVHSVQLLEAAMRENQELKKTITRLGETGKVVVSKQNANETDVTDSQKREDCLALDELKQKIKRESAEELKLVQQALFHGKRCRWSNNRIPMNGSPLSPKRASTQIYQSPKRASTQMPYPRCVMRQEWSPSQRMQPTGVPLARESYWSSKGSAAKRVSSMSDAKRSSVYPHRRYRTSTHNDEYAQIDVPQQAIRMTMQPPGMVEEQQRTHYQSQIPLTTMQLQDDRVSQSQASNKMYQNQYQETPPSTKKKYKYSNKLALLKKKKGDVVTAPPIC